MANTSEKMEEKKAPRAQDEDRRAREFYRYFEPIRSLTQDGPPLVNITKGEDVGWRPSSSPDLALTAFCQLGALRVNTRRAMLFFFDQDYAYILAEATRSLSLLDSSIQKPGDRLWLGHSKIPRGHSVCEKTTLHCSNPYDVRDPNPGGHFLHVINDLSEDTRFCDQPFVAGGIKARFYAGIPITTPRGINIGAYCVLDDKPRDGLTNDEEEFLRHMGATVMEHLMGMRAKTQQHRGNRMIDGLGAFVDGATDLGRGPTEEFFNMPNGRPSMTHIRNASLRKAESVRSSGAPSLAESRKSSNTTRTPDLPPHSPITASSAPSPRTVLDQERHSSATSVLPSPFSVDSHTTIETAASRRTEDSKAELSAPGVQKTFARAVSVLRDSLEVRGAVIFDTTKISFDRSGSISAQSHTDQSSDYVQSSSTDDQPSDKDSQRHRVRVRDAKQCEALASSVHGENRESAAESAPTKIREGLLTRLLRRYPQGKIWNFNSDGNTSSDDAEDDRRDARRKSDPLLRKKDKRLSQIRDGKELAQLFPGVRSLAIIGLWDQTKSRWLGATIVWDCDPFHVLAQDFELPFLTAFSDVVVAEIHRLESQRSDRAKVDFISSISHELRSPLHGILGSGECIQEQGTDDFTAELVAQIMTCGRTLLDIVDHLLDYSKINFYGRATQDSMRAGHIERAERGSIPGHALKLDNMKSLDAEVSLSAVTQEVVETVYYSFCCSKDKLEILRRRVDMILDIDQNAGVDWRCRIALGAWKRVVINLVGNALKYTDTGYIHVSLTQEKSNAILMVKDSGSGMSTAFLKDRLFTAFAQEDNLHEGTGLGMNLVASILKAIEGSIDVHSEKNVGTTVKATVPLVRTSQRQRNRSSASFENDAVPAMPNGLTVAIPSVMGDPNGPAQIPSAQAVGRKILIGSVIKSCSEMGIRTMPTDGRSTPAADVRFVTEDWVLGSTTQTDRYRVVSGPGATQPLDASAITPLIVLCNSTISMREFKRTYPELANRNDVQLLSQPAAPTQLRKAILACLPGVPTPEGKGLTSSPLAKEPLLPEDEPPPANASAESAKESRPNPWRVGSIDDAVLATPSAEPAVPFATPDYTGASSTAQAAQGVQRTVPIPAPQAPNATSSQLDEASARTSPKGQPPAAEPPAPSPPVLDLLLVDDNPINLQLLTTYAKRHSHRHLRAHNGHHAVEAYKAACTRTPLPPKVASIQQPQPHPDDPPSRQPQVILMDINMPILDGYEATRQIRAFEQRKALRPSTIIALTGLGSAQARQEAYACGIDLFLTKPVKLKELGRILEGLERW